MSITTADIRRIMYGILSPLGLPVHYKEDIPKGEITDERIIIVTSGEGYGKIWATCIVTISICVPDPTPNVANLTRLSYYEDEALKMFKDSIVGGYKGDNYVISLQKNGIEEDRQMRCHYVNLKLSFEVLNVKQ